MQFATIVFMTTEKNILQGVELDPQLDPQDFTFDNQLGMLTQEVQPDATGERQFRVLGFHALQDFGLEELTPITSVRELPENRRFLHMNAKGTGIMLGNTPEVVIRPAYKGPQSLITAWITPPLKSQEVMQKRSRNPESALQIVTGIGKHAARAWIEARVKGEQSVIERIDRGYGDSRLITMNPAPTWLIAQRRLRRLEQGTQATPTWALYRGKDPIKRVGVVISD